jgi:hypothetical protein
MIQNSFSLATNCNLSPQPQDQRDISTNLYQYLIEKCSSDLLPPNLKEAQFTRLTALLGREFTITAKYNIFELKSSLDELFDELKIDSIEIIGGAVFYILGREYMQELAKSLGVALDEELLAEFEKMPADIDIRVYCNDPEAEKVKVCCFFAKKAGMPDNPGEN